MSADNGIYILESKGPEYRVISTQGIDNLYWDETIRAISEEMQADMILCFFGKAKVYKTEAEVIHQAMLLYNDNGPMLEHGICTITDWKDKEFPKK